MRHTMFTILTVATFLVLTAGPALAQGEHFTRRGEPVCIVSGSGATQSVSCTGELAGLGKEDLLIETTVSGFAVFECENPGGNLAPGQNRVLEGPVTEPTTVPADAIKNGRAKFTAGATLTAPDEVSAEEAGCPNDQWTGVNPTVTITDISQAISQSGNLLFTCTASDPEGLSGRVALTCV